MSRISYLRVSSFDQSVEAQRNALGGGFDKEFIDSGVSGAILAKDRPAFAELLSYVREGDSVHLYAVDRLGRDALDVQSCVVPYVWSICVPKRVPNRHRFGKSKKYHVFSMVCGRGGTVDAGDLKSSAHWACGFESRRPHQK